MLDLLFADSLVPATLDRYEYLAARKFLFSPLDILVELDSETVDL